VEKPYSGENRLLQRLAPEDLARLQPHLKEVPLRQGDVLHRAREAIERVYFPKSGMVSLLAVMRSGDMIETAIIGREGMVGGSVASGNWQAFGQATVQIAGSALQMNSKHFVEAINGNERMRKLVQRFDGVLMMQSQQSAACHALHSVESRLCRWLLQSQDVTESSYIELTQEFLSHMLGVQRTSVSLCAHKLQDAGLIEYSRGRITIINRSAIEECACECYSLIRGETDKAIPAIGRAEGGIERRP
jgi:CRP-like cAMP-binding protein